jgi:hypothetical protein
MKVSRVVMVALFATVVMASCVHAFTGCKSFFGKNPQTCSECVQSKSFFFGAKWRDFLPFGSSKGRGRNCVWCSSGGGAEGQCVSHADYCGSVNKFEHPVVTATKCTAVESREAGDTESGGKLTKHQLQELKQHACKEGCTFRCMQSMSVSACKGECNHEKFTTFYHSSTLTTKDDTWKQIAAASCDIGCLKAPGITEEAYRHMMAAEKECHKHCEEEFSLPQVYVRQLP